MTVFRHTVAADEDSQFFEENRAEEYGSFPARGDITLDLALSHLEHALHLLNAAETVAGAFGDEVTIETQTGRVGWLQVDRDEGQDMSWRTSYTAFDIRVLSGTAEVRWRAVHEYDASSITTKYVSRAGLLAMRDGQLPS